MLIIGFRVSINIVYFVEGFVIGYECLMSNKRGWFCFKVVNEILKVFV